MDEIVESEAANEAALEKTGAGQGFEPEPEPKVYVFDGWGLIPLEI